jgi:hypothetical protein
MSDNKTLDINVAIATITPAASDEALQIFDDKHKKKHDEPHHHESSNHPLMPHHKQPEHHEPGSSSDHPEVFEKENKKMIVLGNISDEQHHKPRTASRGKSDSEQESDPHHRPKGKGPSDNLMRPTAARVLEVQELEERRKKKEQPAAAISPKRTGGEKDWTPSDRLLRPTQSRLQDAKEWEAHKERAPYDDDIWWDLRKPAELAKVNPNTPSKLHEPTASFAKSVRPKYEAPPEVTPTKDLPPAHHQHVTPIESDSPLLKQTTATSLHSKRTEIHPPEPPKHVPQLKLVSQATGPQNVASKLSSDTISSKLHKYKTRDQAQQELLAKQEQQHAGHKTASPAQTKKVTGVSSRLMELNESLKQSTRTKVTKVVNDPREAGWAKVHGKTHIPTIEEMHDHMAKNEGGSGQHNNQTSNSTIASHEHNSSGSIMNSAEMNEGHHNEHGLYPDEQQQHQQHHDTHHHHHHHGGNDNNEEDTQSREEELAQGVNTLEVN